ncbi:MAG: hypothetical protein U9Q79_08185, partial [Candidatus Hydrogenedentes bacterium]|nr:hypothetical protein [Candidatus Hydrogenedentota bacterium]
SITWSRCVRRVSKMLRRVCAMTCSTTGSLTLARKGGFSGWLEKKRRACEEISQGGDPLLILAASPDRGHGRAIDRFVDEIRGEGPVVCGIDDAVLATRVAFAAIRSDMERRVVKLEEI